MAPRVTHTWPRNEATGQAEIRGERTRREERNDEVSTAAGCRSLEGVKERPLSSFVFRPVVFVLERVSAWRRISRRKREKEAKVRPARTLRRKGDVRTSACIRINIYTCIYALSGIRHPINLLLANRLANCERMLARANKGASIY